jgi:hypothetical protein
MRKWTFILCRQSDCQILPQHPRVLLLFSHFCSVKLRSEEQINRVKPKTRLDTELLSESPTVTGLQMPGHTGRAMAKDRSRA